AEHSHNQLFAVSGRIRVVRWDADFDLALCNLGRRLVSRNDRERSDTLVVETEVLRERAAHQQLSLGTAKGTQAGRVLLNAFGETLIREVQEGQQAATVNGVGQFCPLLGFW